MILLLALSSALAACTLDTPADAPFEVTAPDDADRVHLVIVVRTSEAQLETVTAIRDLLDARQLLAGFSVPLAEPSNAVASFLTATVETGHDAVVRLKSSELPVDPTKGPAKLRKSLGPLQQYTGKLRVAEAPLGKTSSEAIMQRIGLRTVLETNGPARGAPRVQRRLDGQPNLGAVLPSGPYSGACGSSPVARGFTPAHADRVTQALYGARAKSVSIVRLTLDPQGPEDASVLARWLDSVVLPKKIRISAPLQARQASLKSLRNQAPTDPTSMSSEGGRLVRLDEVRKAAEALRGLEKIPRRLPGDLAPTEAFQAFIRLVADRKEANVVRLSALEGPISPVKGGVSEPTPFDRADVVSLATALLDDMPPDIPTALPVGGTLLSASELLTLFASAARGDDPPMARTIESPEPNAKGLGWGRATTP